jgi:naphtho-gamma-pyrone polyketide synthase
LLPIQTPFHADHLFAFEEVDDDLDSPLSEDLQAYKLQIPIVSPVSGMLIRNGDFRSLLRQASHDTLRGQVRWDKIGSGCTDLISQETCTGCAILPCATNAATLLSASLSSVHTTNIHISDVLNSSLASSQASSPNGRFSDSKIAVIGFSGRFPDAASNDELWALLMAGQDTHRTIPKDRFDWEAHFDASGAKKNTSRVKYGCFVDEPVSQLQLRPTPLLT